MVNKKLKNKFKKFSRGFSLVELIVALGIFGIVASGVLYVVINSYRNYYGVGDRQVVVRFAQEGMEAVKSIRDNSWQSFVAAADDNNHGVVKTNGLWQFSGTSNTLGALTRTIVINAVSRDAGGNIDNGVNYDPNTKKVTVTVSGSGITDYVLVNFLTNWSSVAWEQTDWSGVGASEFWASANKASSSYSNISTSTAGALTLALDVAGGAVPGSYGDWNDANFYATSTYFASYTRGIALSPDQKTLYVSGYNTTQNFKAYDVSQARSGIIKELWTITFNNDVYFSAGDEMEVHPGGRYVYMGTFEDHLGINLIMIIDTETREVNFSTGGQTYGASYSTLSINDIVIDGNASYLYALGKDGRIYAYQITNNGANLTLVNGTGGQVMATAGINEGVIVGSTLYTVTSGGTDAFAKIDISNPAVLSKTYNFAGPSSGRRYAIKYLGTVASKARFLVTGSNGSYEAELIEDQGASATTLHYLTLTGSSHFDIVDGGLGAETYWIYSYYGDLIEVNASSTTGLLYTSAPNCNNRACKYFGYVNNSASSVDYYVDNIVYSSILGGLIILEYSNVTPASFQMYFVPRDETRANGANYGYKRAITIDHTKVANTDQSSFPVLISGTYSYLKTIGNGGKVENDAGYDIIFASDAEGTTILDHEIESYSPTTGAFTAWVRIPTLSASTDTTIYMFYGNSNISASQERASSVWDSNFKFVAHLNSPGTDAERYDSTADQNSIYKYSGDPNTFDVAVSQSSDDAQEATSTGAVTTNGTFFYINYHSSAYYINGLRFQGVSIPKDATILNAYIEFQAHASDSGGASIDSKITGEASDNPSTFTTDANNISSRADTSAAVYWRYPHTWVDGINYRTINIAPIVQELVDRSGWSAGNAMVFKFVSNSGQAYRRQGRSYDYTPQTASTMPRLYISYASSTSGQISGGDTFDYNNDKLIARVNNPTLWQNTSDFTTEFWVKYAGGMSSSHFASIVYKGNGDSAIQEGWFIRYIASTGKLFFHMGNMSTNLNGFYNNQVLTAGTWYHIAMAVNRAVGYQWYVNGAALNSLAQVTTGYTLGTSTALRIGNDYSLSDATQSWLGNIDEVRISHTLRSADWIATSYNSQNNPTTFYSIGDETTIGGFATPGTLYSSIIDLGATDQTLSSISLNQNVPSGCNIVATVEGADDSSFSGAVSVDFSDSSTSSFTSTTPASLNSKRFLRYKLTLTNCNSNASAPTLYSIRLNYR